MPHPTSRHKATTGELVQAGDPANNAVRVNIVAGAGSGGTAATDDSAFTPGGTSITPVGGTYRSVLDAVDDGDTGAFAMTQTRAIFANIRDDAGDSAMDGANNALRVNIVAGAGSGGTAMTDDTAFTPAGTSITPMGAFFDDVASDPVDEGDGGVVRMGADRILYTKIHDGTVFATVRDLASNDALNVAIVDGSGAQITSFGGGTQYTEGDVDATITGTAAMMEVAGNTLQPVQGTVVDGLLVNLGANNDVTVTGTVTANAGTGNFSVVGPAADGAAVSGNPVRIAGKDGGGLTQDILTDTDGNLQIDVLTLPANASVNVAQWNGVAPTAAAALADNFANPTAPPVGAFLMGWDQASANWDRIQQNSPIDNTTAGASLSTMSFGMNFDGSTWDATRGAVNGLNSIGTGLQTAQLVGQFDDTTPPTITENQFGNLRMSSKGVLYGQIRDASGVERGANVSANNALLIDLFNINGAGTVGGGTSGSLGVGGLAAHASPTIGNPVYTAGRASTALPTDVGADGDAAGFWVNRNGATVVAVAPHIGLNSDPYNLIHETAQYTTTQTSTVLVAGGASEKIVVTKVQIQAGGTTAGTLQLYFGTGAYSRGTSRAIFDGEFAPSSTLKPGVVMDGPFISGTNGDDLLVTTSAAINPLTITVWYYVVV